MYWVDAVQIMDDSVNLCADTPSDAYRVFPTPRKLVTPALGDFVQRMLFVSSLVIPWYVYAPVTSRTVGESSGEGADTTATPVSAVGP